MRSQLIILIASLLVLSISNLWANEPQLNNQKADNQHSDNRQANVLHSRAEVERILGPLLLTSELSPDSMQVLVDEAETQYRLGRKDQAMEGFVAILALTPRMSMAWLRIGNLHHQAGRDSDAIEAYQRAVTFSSLNQEERPTRDKALLNISMLYLDKAGSALSILEQAALNQVAKSANDVTDNEREVVHRQLEIRERAQDVDARAQAQINRMRSTGKRTKVSFESTKP